MSVSVSYNVWYMSFPRFFFATFYDLHFIHSSWERAHTHTHSPSYQRRKQEPTKAHATPFILLMDNMRLYTHFHCPFSFERKFIFVFFFSIAVRNVRYVCCADSHHWSIFFKYFSVMSRYITTLQLYTELAITIKSKVQWHRFRWWKEVWPLYVLRENKIKFYVWTLHDRNGSS